MLIKIIKGPSKIGKLILESCSVLYGSIFKGNDFVAGEMPRITITLHVDDFEIEPLFHDLKTLEELGVFVPLLGQSKCAAGDESMFY